MTLQSLNQWADEAERPDCPQQMQPSDIPDIVIRHNNQIVNSDGVNDKKEDRNLEEVIKGNKFEERRST